MVFALDHADASGEVVNILYEALTLEETPIPLKVEGRVCTGLYIGAYTGLIRSSCSSLCTIGIDSQL